MIVITRSHNPKSGHWNRPEIEERDTLRGTLFFTDLGHSHYHRCLGGIRSFSRARGVTESKRVVTKQRSKSNGDWKIKNPEGELGGWYFEYANEFYPDVDDTFQVITALSKVRFTTESKEKENEKPYSGRLNGLSRCRIKMVVGLI